MPAISKSDGPVAVTGASGYNGSHVVTNLVTRGYTVHACVTDTTKPDKVDHLNALNDRELPGEVKLFTGNLLEENSYDAAFEGCSAVFHVGTAMGYGGKNNARQVYDGAVEGTKNILGSIKKSGTIKRLIYTSSYAAIGHPEEPGYLFSEKDWATDNRTGDERWLHQNLDSNGEVAYALAKVDTEHLIYKEAAEDGRFDAISVCPLVVLGPLLSKSHDLVGSWQWFLARMMEGDDCKRGWQHLWNIVDVRDVAESQVLIAESSVCKNGSRYQLTATDESGELDVYQLQKHLQDLFPNLSIGGAPDKMDAYLAKHSKIYDAPRARCDLARKELGLTTHSIVDTLRATGQTSLDLGLIKNT